MYQAPRPPFYPIASERALLSYAGGGTMVPSDRTRHRVRADAGATVVGLLAADAVGGFGLPGVVARIAASDTESGPVILLAAVLVLALIGLSGGYSPRILHDPARQIPLILTACLISIAATALAAWAFGAGQVLQADWGLPAAGAGLAGLVGGRILAGRLFAWTQALHAPRTVVIGGGPVGVALMRTLLAGRMGETPRLLGYIDDQPMPEAGGSGMPPFLGGLADLLTLIREERVDRVIIALPWSAQAPMLELVRQLAECPIQIQLAQDPGNRFAAGPRQEARGTGLLHVMDPPLSGVAGLTKRIEDIAIASIVLLPALLGMAAIALAIRLDGPGPVLFRQMRTGYNNREFEMLKFRTMHHHLADPSARVQATHDDPRVTRVGYWLRRTSLDELPQIFNVLRGDMSIVGPRPHAPGTKAGGRVFGTVVADYAARHRVRPGVTGLAQVRGLRGPTETEDKLARRVNSDLEYMENWSVWLDLLVLARTALAVLRMKNAC